MSSITVSTTTNETQSSKEAIERLKRFFDEGRPIVPFLGAGVSAGSGFPLTETLREYLCKAKFYIRYSVYRRMMGRSIPSAESLQSTDLEYCTAAYLLEYGWPDFNRLTADLWRYAENPFPRDVGSAIWKEWWARLRRDDSYFNDNSGGPKSTSVKDDAYLRATMFLDRCADSLKKPSTKDKGASNRYLHRLKQFRDACGIKSDPEECRDENGRFVRNALKNLDVGQPVWAHGRNRLTSIVEFMLLELLGTVRQLWGLWGGLGRGDRWRLP